MLATAVADDRDDAGLRALMASAQNGDQGAYRQALAASVPMIKRIAHRWGVPPGNVDDVVQEVLLSIHNLLATFDPQRSYHAWLTAIAKRRAIDLLRSHGRRAIREIHEPVAYENHPDDFSVEERAEKRSEARHIGELVSGLPEGQQQAVRILAYGGRSLEEGAELTGRSKTALKVNFHRAIQNLRSRLMGGADGR